MRDLEIVNARLPTTTPNTWSEDLFNLVTRPAGSRWVGFLQVLIYTSWALSDSNPVSKVRKQRHELPSWDSVSSWVTMLMLWVTFLIFRFRVDWCRNYINSWLVSYSSFVVTNFRWEKALLNCIDTTLCELSKLNDFDHSNDNNTIFLLPLSHIFSLQSYHFSSSSVEFFKWWC